MATTKLALEWKQKSAGSLRGILDDVNRWDLAPYPPLIDKELDRIDLVLTAATATGTPDTQPILVGIVGIALVQMSRHQVEGYLSMVAVRPDHRHEGIGTALIRGVIQALIQTKPPQHDSKEPALSCPVEMHRLRLHTIRSGTTTLSSATTTHVDTVTWYSRLGFQVRRVIPKYYRFSPADEGVEMVLDSTISRKRDRLQ